VSQILLPALKGVLDDLATKDAGEIAEFKKGMNQLLDIYRYIVVEPYDLKQDRRGYYSIQPFIKVESANIKPRKKPTNETDLVTSVRDLIGQFQRAIEDNGGNKLLYRKSDTGALQKEKPHNEDVAQIIFYLIADVFCQQANILLARESDAGRGPVDFSLGTGYHKKVLAEIKKSDNKNLENGFNKQVTTYQKSEKAIHSFYVVIKTTQEQSSKKKITTQLERVEALYADNKKKGLVTPELMVIDGLIHPSPSKLK